MKRLLQEIVNVFREIPVKEVDKMWKAVKSVVKYISILLVFSYDIIDNVKKLWKIGIKIATQVAGERTQKTNNRIE